MTGAVPNGVKARRGPRRKPRPGIALISDEFVGDAQFLAQPNNANGLRDAQMMNNEHGRYPLTLRGLGDE